jgi:hypothetical protein
VTVVAAVGGVGGGGFEEDAEAGASPDHLVGGAGVQIEPQGDAAGRAGPADGGSGGGQAPEAVFQVLEVLGEQPGAPLDDLIQRRQQPGGGDLVERAGAGAGRDGGGAQLPGEGGRGADPAQAQPAPHGLAQRGDDDDPVVDRGQRGAPVAGQVQRPHRLVGHDQPARGGGAGGGVPGRDRHDGAGRVVAVGLDVEHAG